MPDLDEGDLLYMPSTFPAVSIGKAQELLQQTDKLIKTVPEVQRVFGKVGRAGRLAAFHAENASHQERTPVACRLLLRIKIGCPLWMDFRNRLNISELSQSRSTAAPRSLP